MHDHPLVQLTLTRMREFYREPEAVFWVFGFPIVLAFALGLAFRNTGPGELQVGVAPGADLRTDIPRYRIYKDGVLADEVADATPYWRDDLVAFLLGCSFTFEWALLDAGIRLWHVEHGKNVAMWRTSTQCRPAGVFHGPMVVSMRPIAAAQLAKAVTASARFPGAHGAPVHVGDPAALGITDIARPDWGDPQEFARGDVPVFWACGVTPQAVALASKPPFMITHSPGHMFITDVPNSALAAI